MRALLISQGLTLTGLSAVSSRQGRGFLRDSKSEGLQGRGFSEGLLGEVNPDGWRASDEH